MDKLFRHGIELFNAGEFFAAHEVLEDVWRPCHGPERLFLQGLIQVAVALHHHSTGNIVGARSLLRRANQNLSGFPLVCRGIDVNALRESIAAWQIALDNNHAVPVRPRIKLSSQREC